MMEPRRTAHGQTLLELSTEFMENLKKNTSGSKDMDTFFDMAVNMEQQPSTMQIKQSITDVHRTGFSAYSLNLLKNCRPNVTDVLLSWICNQSNGIPEYIETLLGMYCVVFYATHAKEEQLTLRWVGEQVGKGKLVSPRQFFPYAAVSKGSDGVNMFSTLTPEELYTAG